MVTLLVAVVGFGGAWMVSSALASVHEDIGGAQVLESLDSGPQASLIYDRNNKLSYSLFTEQRIDVSLGQISPNMIKALLAAEDQRFYDHSGLDRKSVV